MFQVIGQVMVHQCYPEPRDGLYASIILSGNHPVTIHVPNHVLPVTVERSQSSFMGESIHLPIGEISTICCENPSHPRTQETTGLKQVISSKLRMCPFNKHFRCLLHFLVPNYQTFRGYPTVLAIRNLREERHLLCSRAPFPCLGVMRYNLPC